MVSGLGLLDPALVDADLLDVTDAQSGAVLERSTERPPEGWKLSPETARSATQLEVSPPKLMVCRRL